LSLIESGQDFYAGTLYNGVWKSTNYGSNWVQTSLSGNQTIPSLAANGNSIFAGATGNGVYVSSDGGVNWIQKNEGLGNRTVHSLCVITNFILAGTGLNGIWIRPLGQLTGIETALKEIPEEYSLSQNYPNPFNPATKIKFALPKSSFVKLIVYDILGREITTLVNEELSPGTYEVEWDATSGASNYPSGVYFYKLITNDHSETKKMMLVK
jgi:hypothetical protein